MATRYLRSTDGSDADDGSTWALAKGSIDNSDGIASIDTAGDTIWVSQSHAESTAAALAINIAGTVATPSKLLCGNDAAEPPTALAATGSITATGANNITFFGSFYCYGLTFISGAVVAAGQASATNECQYFENCSFQTTSASTGGISMGGTGNSTKEITFKDCRVKFAHANNGWTVLHTSRIQGGSVESGSTTPTALFRFATDRTPANFTCDGFDFSNFSAGLVLFSTGSILTSGRGVLRNCKLPASWSGTLLSAAPSGPGVRYEMYNCAAGDTNYALWVEEYSGSIRDETTIVKSSGASDGTTSFAWKMATTANAEYPTVILRSPEIKKWNETTGSAITVTVEIVHDSQGSGTSSAFTDQEIWLEVQYLGTSGFPLSTFIDDAAADVLASAADQTSSSVTWTTTGLSTPVKQKLSVSFTPQEKGMIIATVCMAGASDTCYVNPQLDIS